MRVLSLDGGGVRGIISIVVLADLEARAGRPVPELFDLVAGTSTGAIIGCALTLPRGDGTPRWRAADLLGLYRQEGPRIFQKSLGRQLRTAFGLLEERYDDEALNDVLDRYLGPAPISAALTRLLVTAYDLEERAPYFFKSWRAAEEPVRDHRMWAAARASSAAPSYFEPLALREGERRLSLVDGGVFATNPAMCAYAEVRRLEGRDPGVLAALGTGELTRRIRHEDAAGWGLAEWVRPVIDVVFDGVADTVDYQAGKLLGDGYRRFQIPLRNGASDALDDASAENLRRLEEHGRALVRDRAADLDRLAGELAGG